MNKKLILLIGIFVILSIVVVLGLFSKKTIDDNPEDKINNEVQDQTQADNINSNRVGILISEDGLNREEITITVLEDEPDASLVIANDSSENATISVTDNRTGIEVYKEVEIRPKENVELYINYFSTFTLLYTEKNQSKIINITNP